MEQQVPVSTGSGATQDEKNLGLLLWFTTIFFVIIPGLAYYLVKQDSPYLLAQAKEAINWSITAILGYVAGVILAVIVIGFLIIAAVAVLHLVFCIMGMVATARGDSFRVPFALRLIK
jgi:uncharacterized protein